MVARTDYGTIVIDNDILKLAKNAKQKEHEFRAPFLPSSFESQNYSVLSTSLPLKNPANIQKRNITEEIDHSQKRQKFESEPVDYILKALPSNLRNTDCQGALMQLLYGTSMPVLPPLRSSVKPQVTEKTADDKPPYLAGPFTNELRLENINQFSPEPMPQLFREEPTTSEQSASIKDCILKSTRSYQKQATKDIEDKRTIFNALYKKCEEDQVAFRIQNETTALLDNIPNFVNGIPNDFCLQSGINTANGKFINYVYLHM